MEGNGRQWKAMSCFRSIGAYRLSPSHLISAWVAEVRKWLAENFLLIKVDSTELYSRHRLFAMIIRTLLYEVYALFAHHYEIRAMIFDMTFIENYVFILAR